MVRDHAARFRQRGFLTDVPFFFGGLLAADLIDKSYLGT